MEILDQNIIAAAGGILGLLLSANGWFIRRLVIKLDNVDKVVLERLPVQRQEIKTLLDRLVGLEGQIKQLTIELKDFSLIREKIAVLEEKLRRIDDLKIEMDTIKVQLSATHENIKVLGQRDHMFYDEMMGMKGAAIAAGWDLSLDMKSKRKESL